MEREVSLQEGKLYLANKMICDFSTSLFPEIFWGQVHANLEGASVLEKSTVIDAIDRWIRYLQRQIASGRLQRDLNQRRSLK